MINCPTKGLKEWTDLVEAVGEDKAHLLWNEYEGYVPEKYYEIRQEPKTIDKTIPQVSFEGIISNSEKELFAEDDTTDRSSLNDNSDAKLLLFGSNTATQSKADDVLKRLISSDVYTDKLHEGFFLERLMNLVGKSGSNLVIATTNMPVYKDFIENKQVAMVHDSMTNTIYVTEDSMQNFSKYDLAGAFIHEAAHSTTLQAYFNPKTFEEKEFKRFIDKAFAQYKHLSTWRDAEGRSSYGFTNQAEFISEIFSNPNFRNEIENIEKGFMAKFMEEVRRIMYLIKNGLNKELVKASVLFEVVDQFSTADKSKWKGTLVRDPRYEVFGRILPKTISELENETIDDKISRLLDKQLDNMDVIVRKAHKNSGTKEGAVFLSKISGLEEAMTEASSTSKLEAINLYADFMIDQIIDIYNKLQKPMVQSQKLELVDRYKTYLGATDLLDTVLDTLTDSKISQLSKEQQTIAKSVLEKLRGIGGAYNEIKATFKSMAVDGLRLELKSSYFAEKVIRDFRDEIAKDYPTGHKLSKDRWVDLEVKKRQDELDDLIENDIDRLLDKSSVDISSFDYKAYSVLNTKSRLIQITWKIIERIKSKFNQAVVNNDFYLKGLYDNLIKEKGKYDVSNLIEYDSDGTPYVIGEYSLEYRRKHREEYSPMLSELYELMRGYKEKGLKSAAIHKKADVKAMFVKLNKWRGENVIFNEHTGAMIPLAKWKNDLTKLSPAEKAIHKAYVKMSETSKKAFGKKSIRSSVGGATYLALPYSTKSTMERIMEKGGGLDPIAYGKHKWGDLVDWKIDDVEAQEEMYNSRGNKIYNIPVLYRNNIDKKKDPEKYALAVKEQSADLLTLMRLEFRNHTNFTLKQEQELTLNTLVEVAKEKRYIRTSGNSVVSNLFGIRSKEVLMEGVQSNEYKRLESIVNQSLYNQFMTSDIKFLGKDVNKLVKTVNSWTGFLGMTFNYFSAPVNVLNAEFQTFLLKMGKDIGPSAMSSAHAAYFKEMPDILADTGRPVALSMTNQLNTMFDVFGGLTSDQNEFIKNSIIKANANLASAQVLQSSGDHMVQSILNLAILKTIKVQNANKRYINKDGKVVKTREEGATLFDMISLNPETKQIEFSGDFEYTDKSTVTPWEEGGFENVKLFIKKKIEDTMGQHDKNYQSEYQKHWFGQLLSMYKKHVIPLGLTRFKGMGDKTKVWNEFSQEYEEGFYTTASRLVFGPFSEGIVNGLNNLKLSLLTSRYKELSEYEKNNIRKMVTETGMLVLLNFLIVPLFMGLGGDDDDDIYLQYLALTTRRLEQELSFYVDINDAYKVTKNPIAALNTVEDMLSIVKYVTTPSALFSENADGESRFLNSLEKAFLPNVFRDKTTISNSLKYMNRNLIIPYQETATYKAMFGDD